jgi:hypothetical protein
VEIVGGGMQRRQGLIGILRALKIVCGVVYVAEPFDAISYFENTLERIAEDLLFVFVIELNAVFIGDLNHFGKLAEHLFFAFISLIKAEHSYFFRAENVCKAANVAYLCHMLLKVCGYSHLSERRADRPHLDACVLKLLCVSLCFVLGELCDVCSVKTAELNEVYVVSFKSFYLPLDHLVRLVGECA